MSYPPLERTNKQQALIFACTSAPGFEKTLSDKRAFD
jgi:hypothetical protein